jgi:hypothetical protein
MPLRIGKPWTNEELFFLDNARRRGMSLEDIADFLGRTADEVGAKAKQLNEYLDTRSCRGIDTRRAG